jgi:hypothetical protein
MYLARSAVKRYGTGVDRMMCHAIRLRQGLRTAAGLHRGFAGGTFPRATRWCAVCAERIR